jgi:dihydrofolate reductase
VERTFDLIVACDLNRGIGKEGNLPWKLRGDMRHFKEITVNAAAGLKNAVIMGRKTWQSIPQENRPLPDRLNLVLTSDANFQLPNLVLKCNSLSDAWLKLAGHTIDKCFVIGGANLYAQCINHPSCTDLYLTEIQSVFACDVFFPEFQENYSLVSSSEMHEEKAIKYCFKTYRHVQ